jgi:hypothetical protein
VQLIFCSNLPHHWTPGKGASQRLTPLHTSDTTLLSSLCMTQGAILLWMRSRVARIAPPLQPSSAWIPLLGNSATTGVPRATARTRTARRRRSGGSPRCGSARTEPGSRWLDRSRVQASASLTGACLTAEPEGIQQTSLIPSDPPGTPTPAPPRSPRDDPGPGCTPRRGGGARCRRPPAHRPRPRWPRSAPAEG